MIIDNNPFYIVAKKFDEIGCIAYQFINCDKSEDAIFYLRIFLKIMILEALN